MNNNFSNIYDFIFADFHIHSKYSIGSSKNNNFYNIFLSAYKKGISIIATGDILYKKWYNEFIDILSEQSKNIDNGLYLIDLNKTSSYNNNFINFYFYPRFILTTEVSLLYKENGKVKKNHILIIFPSLKTVEKTYKKLTDLGLNLNSDGRPILGLSSKDLVYILKNIDEDIFIIPAHIWTPWFSILGEKSGYNSFYECFGENIYKIYAIETGLSTDPSMHWLFSDLDKFALISNSDSHNVENLGRNANIFNLKEIIEKNYPNLINKKKEFYFYNYLDCINYKDIINSIKEYYLNNKFFGTLNLFPQEGKYYFDGHRNCNFKSSPEVSLHLNQICPICNKKLTKGVLHRIYELKDRKSIDEKKNKKYYKNIVPFKEILNFCFDKKISKIKIEKIFVFFLTNIEKELYLLTFYDDKKFINLIEKNYILIQNFLNSNFFNDKNRLQNDSLNFILNIFREKLPNILKKIEEKSIQVDEGFDCKYGKITF